MATATLEDYIAPVDQIKNKKTKQPLAAWKQEVAELVSSVPRARTTVDVPLAILTPSAVSESELSAAIRSMVAETPLEQLSAQSFGTMHMESLVGAIQRFAASGVDAEIDTSIHDTYEKIKGASDGPQQLAGLLGSIKGFIKKHKNKKLATQDPRELELSEAIYDIVENVPLEHLSNAEIDSSDGVHMESLVGAIQRFATSNNDDELDASIHDTYAKVIAEPDGHQQFEGLLGKVSNFFKKRKVNSTKKDLANHRIETATKKAKDAAKAAERDAAAEEKAAKLQAKLEKNMKKIKSLAPNVYGSLPPLRPLSAYGTKVAVTDDASFTLLPEERALADTITSLVSSGQPVNIASAAKFYQKLPGDPTTHYESNLALGTAMSFAKYHCANSRHMVRQMGSLLATGADGKAPVDEKQVRNLATHLNGYVHAVNRHAKSLHASEEEQDGEAQRRGSLLGAHLVEHLGATVALASAMNDIVALTQTRLNADANETRIKLAGFWGSTAGANEDHEQHAAEHFK